MRTQKTTLKAVSLILSLTLLLCFWGCGSTVNAENLMDGITASDVVVKKCDDEFLSSQLSFAFELLRQNGAKEQNVILSPSSIGQALGMLANGADGETLKQIENVLGGGMPIDDLNAYYRKFLSSLENDETVRSANSVWFKEGFDIKESFLKKNADYYGADAYASPFNHNTVNAINNWVSVQTKNNIKKIINNIDPLTRAILVNCIYFNADWADPYKPEKIDSGVFTSVTEQKQRATYMESTEKYISDKKTFEGIIKPYKDNKYSFIAIKPYDRLIGQTFDYTKFITQDLNADTVIDAIMNSNEKVLSFLPQFNIDFENSQTQVLKNMGITDAFDTAKADLSKISDDVIHVSDIIHKANIEVNDKGTEASGATAVKVESIGSYSEKPKTVKFNRPFIYMIVETETCLPIFIGSVTTMNK